MEENSETKINIENNKNLKNQLKLISTQIEEALNRHKSKISENNVTDNLIEIDLQKSAQFKHTIDEYKKQINFLNYELQNNRNYVNTIKNENEIKNIKNKLIEKKKEFDTLMTIKKNQEKAIEEFSGRYSTKAEIAGLYQKCKNLKEEIKIKKEFNKKLIENVKEKNKELIQLNDNCNLIKENIEYKKTADKINENIDKEIEDLKIKIKQNQSIFKNQEKNYLNNLNKQNNKMLNLDEEINIIKVQIHHKIQEQKINLLKIKELEKLYLEIKQKEKFKKEEERNYFNNNNFKSQNIQSNFDDYNYDQEINENNNNIYNNNISNAESQKISSRKIPFVIGKFNSNKNVNQSYTNLHQPFSDFSSAHNISHHTHSEKIKDPVFKEIENLKLDIKNALLENSNDISDIEHLNNPNNLLDENDNNNNNNNNEFFNEEVNEEIVNDNEIENQKSFVQFSYNEEQEN